MITGGSGMATFPDAVTANVATSQYNGSLEQYIYTTQQVTGIYHGHVPKKQFHPSRDT